MVTIERLPVAPLAPEEMFPGERGEKLARTLEVIKAVSRMAGNQLEVNSLGNPDKIENRPGVCIVRARTRPNEVIENADFEFEPDLLSGVADSAHTVVAGKLFIDYVDDPERQEIAAAAKCFYKRTPEERFTRAVREVAVMQDMQRKGELTIHPIALAIAPKEEPADGEVIIVTEYDPALLTLDNNPWGRGPTTTNRELAAVAARAVSHFNHIGYKHGDAKIKNVAQHESGGKVGMIDYETTEPIDPTDPNEVHLAAYIDFQSLLNSLIDKGFTNGKYVDRERLFTDMADAYLEEWAHDDPNVQSAVLSGITSAIDSLTPAPTAIPK